MKRLELIIEQAADGQLWGRMHYGDDLLTSAADTEAQLVQNFKEQLVGFYELDPDKIKLQITYDLKAVFERFEELSISGIAKRSRLNTSLLRQYVTGHKRPGKDQVVKIQQAFVSLADDLKNIKLAGQ